MGCKGVYIAQTRLHDGQVDQLIYVSINPNEMLKYLPDLRTEVKVKEMNLWNHNSPCGGWQCRQNRIVNGL